MIKKIIPILEWLPNYDKKWWRGDLAAGFTVGIMLIPQGMAYAMVAGLPPVYGLYAALVPNLVYAVLGSSRKLSVGPVALDSLIVASGLAAMKLSTPSEYLSMAFVLSLLVGGIQLLMGVLKMGFLANFISRPVVAGFTNAAAFIIGISQLKYILGIPINSSATIQTLIQLFQQIKGINLWDLSIGVGGILSILLLKKAHKNIPAAMILIVVGIMTVYFLHPPEESITLLGQVPAGLPSFQVHVFREDKSFEIFTLAIVLAFIAFAEAMTIGKAVEEQQKEYFIRPNQELKALGIANVIGSFFQSYPTNASLSRTAVNVEEGAKTGLSGVVSAMVVALCLLFFTHLFQYLPNALLGAIIIVALFKLIDFDTARTLLKNDTQEFILLLFTFFMTLFVGITEGIISGVLGSLMLVVYRLSQPQIPLLGKLKGSEYFKNIDRFEEEVELHPEILILRFDAYLFFANVHHLTKKLRKEMKVRNDKLEYVILNAETMTYMDSTAVGELEKIISELTAQNIILKVSGAIGPVRDILFRTGLMNTIGLKHMHVRTIEAFEDSLSNLKKTDIQTRISLQHQ